MKFTGMHSTEASSHGIQSQLMPSLAPGKRPSQIRQMSGVQFTKCWEKLLQCRQILRILPTHGTSNRMHQFLGKLITGEESAVQRNLWASSPATNSSCNTLDAAHLRRHLLHIQLPSTKGHGCVTTGTYAGFAASSFESFKLFPNCAFQTVMVTS